VETAIDELTRQSALSLRQYQRRFSEEVGLNPTLFAESHGFELAIDAKRLYPDNSWLSVDHQFGHICSLGFSISMEIGAILLHR
jgi:hypothetical protein